MTLAADKVFNLAEIVPRRGEEIIETLGSPVSVDKITGRGQKVLPKKAKNPEIVVYLPQLASVI